MTPDLFKKTLEFSKRFSQSNTLERSPEALQSPTTNAKPLDILNSPLMRKLAEIRQPKQPVQTQPVQQNTAGMFRKILNNTRNLFGQISKGGINTFEVKNEQPVFNPQPLYLPENKLTYKAKPVPQEYMNSIKSASQRTGIDPVLLTATLMKESEMGTKTEGRNIAHLLDPALTHLKEKEIKVDLSTPKGVIDAMADYYKIRKKGFFNSGKTYDYEGKPIELYMDKYYTDKEASLDRRIFEHYYNSYKDLFR